MANDYGARGSRRHQWIVFLVAAAGMALIGVSCGGSGGSGGDGDVGIVANVMIEPGTTLLPDVGVSRQLRATAYDANGDPVDVEIAWRSSDTAKVTVDAAGVITSQDTVGSARLTATADGVDSRPARAFLVVPAVNAVFVDDDQIGDLAAVDPDADYALGFQYQATVDGLDQAPTLGDLLIGTGDQPVGGRAIDIVEQGDGVYLVTLELVGLDEMFAELVIDETFDFTSADVESGSSG